MKRNHRMIARILTIIFCFCITFGTLNVFGLESDGSSAALSGKVLEVQIPAPSLSNNILGESDKQPAILYLPPSYDAGKKSYPVVYFLHGWADELKLYKEGYRFKMKEVMDKLISEKRSEEMIVVIANANTKYLGSFFTNSSVTGNWEDFFVKDVVNYMDSNYRTQKDSKYRGLGGFSMGGYGALNIAMKHPDIFGSVYALSPGLFNQNGLFNTVMFDSENSITEYLKIEKELNSKPLTEAKKELFDNIVNWKFSFPFIFAVSYGTCLSPDPDKVIPINYPYKQENGKLVLDKEVLKAWDSGFGNVQEEIVKYKENLLKLGEIRIDYAVHDGFKWIPEGNRYYAQVLKREGIPYTLLTFDGDHADKVNDRLEQYILPYFSKRFFSAPPVSSNSNIAPEEYRLASWAKDQVNTLWEKDMGDAKVFGDYNSNISREEFAMLAIKLVEKYFGKACEKADASTFNDIDQSIYAEDILKAYKLGITKGKGNGKFNPKGQITRQEMAAMVFNLLKAIKPDGDYKAKSEVKFSDSDKIDSWAKDAHAYLFEQNIITGTDNLTISPLANTTRQEALVIGYRTAKLLGVIQ
ncbi:MAG: alpha/beta hydrolase-fold protein [Clostridia bacterium]|nr:alpha/beta hydrolase-fold protein [Clostridia bacterium]